MGLACSHSRNAPPLGRLFVQNGQAYSKTVKVNIQVLQRGVAQVRSVGDVLAVSLFAGLVDEQQLIGVGVADVHELGQSVEERIYCELHERPSLSPMCQYAL